jgi:uncharacterized glyoxalase superfamily protein PhnB
MPTTLIPYIAVHDGAAAIAFYIEAFGATETMRITMDDGRLGHGELAIGDAVFYISDEWPEMAVLGPRSLGGTSFAMYLEVDAVDAAFDQAVRAGATALRPVADSEHGRVGTLLDPFGHRWMLNQLAAPTA